jgi:hypothetical protein
LQSFNVSEVLGIVRLMALPFDTSHRKSSVKP